MEEPEGRLAGMEEPEGHSSGMVAARTGRGSSWHRAATLAHLCGHTGHQEGSRFESFTAVWGQAALICHKAHSAAFPLET